MSAPHDAPPSTAPAGRLPGTSTHAVAPAAPGRIGEAVDAVAAARYLDALGTWVRLRRAELDELDRTVLAGTRPAAEAQRLTSDIALSLMVWKACSDRLQLLLATWKGGRVNLTDRQRLATLIWGRLDATLDPALLSRAGTDRQAADLATGLAVSLPEACRLSDALAGQLRARLQLDPAAGANALRIRELRASVERIRDQVALEPPVARPTAQATLDRLARRVDDVYAKARRGGDVGGLLGPLEIDAARTERDLIVGAAKRRDARDLVNRAREQRADLAARSDALAELADRCVDTVEPAPRFAVPDVTALGPVPNTPTTLQAYLARLDRVSKALTFAQSRYADALDEHTELAGRVEALDAKARALGIAGQPDLGSALAGARSLLARRPAPMPVARKQVELYQAWLDWLADEHTRAPRHSSSPSRTSPSRSAQPNASQPGGPR